MRSGNLASNPSCKRILTMFLSTVLAVTSCVTFYPISARTVQAINVKTVTGLGTGTISNPSSAAGGWDYVYFGTSSSDIRFRVLDTSATEFGGNTMLLDCDTTLLTSPQDSTDPYTYGSSGWTNGSVKSVLESTVLNMFSPQEIAAISRSYKAAPAAGDGEAWDVLEFVPLTGEKLFALDAVEITRASYGYADCDARDDNRVKTGAESWYWLRSPYTTSNNVCASINPHGDVDGSEPYCPCGVSPALNIDLNSIIFTSSVGSLE